MLVNKGALVPCRVLVTDDRGLLCKRDQLDYKTGCCSSGQQFDCNM